MIARTLLPLCAALALCLGAAPTSAGAQDKPRSRTASKQAAPKATPSKAKRKLRKTEEPRPPAPEAHAQHVAPPPPPTAAGDDEGDVHKEGGTEIKTLEFTGLDIEGQLKTPQMLYFLNRLRAEFARPELPHRSFIPELSRSSKEKDR
jgi:hypothetical protein